MAELDDKALITAYLLGRMLPSEKEKFEERYFTENKLLEQLETTEHELIEQYLGGSLAADREKEFESSFRSNPSR